MKYLVVKTTTTSHELVSLNINNKFCAVYEDIEELIRKEKDSQYVTLYYFDETITLDKDNIIPIFLYYSSYNGINSFHLDTIVNTLTMVKGLSTVLRKPLAIHIIDAITKKYGEVKPDYNFNVGEMPSYYNLEYYKTIKMLLQRYTVYSPVIAEVILDILQKLELISKKEVEAYFLLKQQIDLFKKAIG